MLPLILNEKRNELKIVYDLLSLSNTKPVNKTHLMYQTNLSYAHFIKYLLFLIESDFLKLETDNGSGNKYCITDRGKQYLKEFKDVLDIMP